MALSYSSNYHCHCRNPASLLHLLSLSDVVNTIGKMQYSRLKAFSYHSRSNGPGNVAPPPLLDYFISITTLGLSGIITGLINVCIGDVWNHVICYLSIFCSFFFYFISLVYVSHHLFFLERVEDVWTESGEGGEGRHGRRRGST